MAGPKGYSRPFRRRLKDAGVLLAVMFALALAILFWQGSVSVRGDPGTVGQTGKAFTPVGSTESWAVPATAASVTAPLREAGPNAAKRPLLIPKQLPDGAPRWTDVLTKAMPPFQKWALPAALSGLLGAGGPGEEDSRAAAALPYTFPDLPPKVALLFLTRDWLPYEPVWAAFLASVPDLGGQQGWRLLFSLYVHAPPGNTWGPGSLFTGREIAGRIPVEWGQWSVVQAEVLLLKAALDDPANARFVLLSETCIPLYPATVVWAQLLGERKSRVNACRHPEEPRDEEFRMTYRWADAMEGPLLRKEHWRKSNQWFSLTARHAELIVQDTVAAAAFAEHCWVDAAAVAGGWGPTSFCPPDEHYIPTLLASLGRENETDCKGELTAVWWEGPYFHPKEFVAAEVTPRLIEQLRVAAVEPGSNASVCRAQDALKSAASLWPNATMTASSHHRRQLWQGAEDLLGGGSSVEAFEAALAEALTDALSSRGSGAGRQLRQEMGRPMKGVVEPRFQGEDPGGYHVPEDAAEAGAAGAGVRKAGDGGVEVSAEVLAAEEARVAGFLALAQAVRGNAMTDSAVGYMDPRRAEKPPVSEQPLSERLKAALGFGGRGAPAPAPAQTVFLNDTAAWSADAPHPIAQALLKRFTPLGSSSCPLFARKFGDAARGSVEQLAADFLAGRRRVLQQEQE